MRSAHRSRAALADSRWRAGLILAVLLAHLLFMNSPMHDAMLGMESAAPPVVHLESSQSRAVALDAATHHEFHGHCAIEWATASRGVVPITPPAVTIVATVSGLDCQYAAIHIVRAIGPPADGDAQALLQVFRL